MKDQKCHQQCLALFFLHITMEINETTKQILRSIHGRYQKYKEFGLSRYEYEKYGVSERIMRWIINKLQIEGFIEKVRCENYQVEWKPKRRNIWRVTSKLLDLVKSFTKSILDMNAKIIDWCKQNPIQKLRDMGVFVANNGRIWDKKSKTTVNKWNGAITNWKTWETWNIFNYLRDKENCDTLYFLKHFIWN